MADVKSINGNPIVLDGGGIVDGSIAGVEIASSVTFETINSMNLIKLSDVAQGSLSTLTDPDSARTTSSKRISAKLSFDAPIDIVLAADSTGYSYAYAAFDANDQVIESDSTYTVGEKKRVAIKGVSALNLIIRNTAGTAIIPSDFRGSGIYAARLGDFYSLGNVSAFAGLAFSSDKLPRERMYWEKGGYGSEDLDKTVTNKRIRTYLVPFFSKSFMVKFSDSTYKILGYFYDVDGNYIGNIYGGAGNKSHNFTTEDTRVELGDFGRIAYASFVLARVDEADIALTEAATAGITIEKIGDCASTPSTIKVMTYNIGRFSYGVEPKYLSTNYDQKLANYKRFFSEQQCDVIGLQECNVYLDGATSGTQTADGNIFDYLLPYNRNSANWTCIKSRLPLFNKSTGELSSGRSYVAATVFVGGKAVRLLSVHFTPNAGAEQDAIRAQEAQDVIDSVSGYDRFIVFGDFNAQTTAFYDVFLNAGFKIANGGYLPFEWTCSLNSSDWSADTPSTSIRYYDNIITSSNIVIDYSERLNVYSELSSDHVPFVANVTVL